jgi:hypothetical protein
VRPTNSSAATRRVLVAALLTGTHLSAEERPGAAPVQLEVTEATTLLYAWDNRDYAPNDVGSLVNDDWGVWYNRLNIQASSGDFRFGLRLDNAWYFTSPDPTAVALELTERRPPSTAGVSAPTYFRNKVYEAGRELSNRYINWLYPAKLHATWSRPELEVTAGDLYAELGHGLVLSVRKRDELSSDDTVRGARLNARLRVGGVRIGLTALGGSLNPLRIDEGSGRYLAVDDSVTPGFLTLTEAGMPRAVATDFVPDRGNCAAFATCTYAPDRVVAGQLTLGLERLKLGTQGSFLARQAALSNDSVRSADAIGTLSQSLELSSADGNASFQIEAATQKLGHNDAERGLPAGHAVYASATFALGPLALLIEAKHYRRFFPLLANVNVANAREYAQLAWSAPPTAEASFVDTEFGSSNTCVTGGRARSDVLLARGVSVFGWFGFFQTFGEVPNDRCEIAAAYRNDILDLASGFELRSRDGRARGTVTAGARFDDADAELAPEIRESRVYRELYTRYDAVRPLAGPFTLELQGFHRRRRRPLEGSALPWFEGEHTTGLGVGSAWTFAVGVEYDTNLQPPDAYLNGLVRFRPTPESSVSLFGGQRRSSLRCVGGVCRVVPGFEGMRLDASVRF